MLDYWRFDGLIVHVLFFSQRLCRINTAKLISYRLNSNAKLTWVSNCIVLFCSHFEVFPPPSQGHLPNYNNISAPYTPNTELSSVLYITDADHWLSSFRLIFDEVRQLSLDYSRSQTRKEQGLAYTGAGQISTCYPTQNPLISLEKFRRTTSSFPATPISSWVMRN